MKPTLSICIALLLLFSSCSRSSRFVVRDKLLGTWKLYATGGDKAGLSQQYSGGRPVPDSIDAEWLFRDDDSLVARYGSRHTISKFRLDGRIIWLSDGNFRDMRYLDDSVMLIRYDPGDADIPVRWQEFRRRS